LSCPYLDYSLNNPDTLTKYKTAGTISEKVLAEVSKLIVPGEKIVTICEKGDKILEEEVSKVYAKTKFKGQSFFRTWQLQRALSFLFFVLLQLTCDVQVSPTRRLSPLPPLSRPTLLSPPMKPRPT
jgi:hypothetical protein